MGPCARIPDDQSPVHTEEITSLLYLPKKINERVNEVSIGCETWALGCILYELCAGSNLWEQKGDHILILQSILSLGNCLNRFGEVGTPVPNIANDQGLRRDKNNSMTKFTLDMQIKEMIQTRLKRVKKANVAVQSVLDTHKSNQDCLWDKLPF
jgi:hypothetical protein